MKKQFSVFLAFFSAVSLSSCNGELFGSVEELDNNGSFIKKNNGEENPFYDDGIQKDPFYSEGSESTELTRIYFKEPVLDVFLNKKTKIRVFSEPYQVYYDSLLFELSDPSFGVVDEKGYFTAKQVGTFTLSVHGPFGLSATCTVNVFSAPLKEINAPEYFSLTVGEKNECDFTYSIFPDHASCDIKYFLEDSSIASVVNDLLVATKAAYTRVVFYDDANHNNVRDNDEISAFSNLTVHDFRDVTNVIQPTHTMDGKTTRLCSCGCGATRTSIIPASKHTFDSGVVAIEPTCTLSGELVKTCTSPTCEYHYSEVIPALGHTPDGVKHADKKHLASLGNHFEKAKYYYECSTCHDFSDDTFSRNDDYSNYFTTDILPKYYKNDANGLSRALSVLKKVDAAGRKYSYSHRPFSFSVDTEGVSYFELDWMLNTALTSGETSPFVNPYASNTWYNGNGQSWSVVFNCKYRQDEIDAFHEAFDKVEKEVDALIRDDATDIEKALIIMLYVCNNLTYQLTGFLPDAVKYKTGQCSDYAEYFLYLAHRHGLASYYVLGRRPEGYYEANPDAPYDDHGWVNVCIDGTWYMIDPTWCDSFNWVTLNYFCVQNDDHDHNKLIQNGNPTSVSLKNGNLNNKLIQLYKNNNLAGIYYDMDKVIENINDSSADYKIILGVGVEGVANLDVTLPKYSVSYTTTKTSCSCKSLKIQRCSVAGLENLASFETPVFYAPSSFLSLPNVSFSNVSPSAK